MHFAPDELNLPGAHGVHVASPAADAAFPLVHATHAPGEVWPVSGLDLPMAHVSQTVWPSAAEYLPTAQALHVDCPEVSVKVPAWHLAQGCCWPLTSGG